MKKIISINIISLIIIFYYILKNVIYYLPVLGNIKEIYLPKIMFISGIIGVMLNVLIAIWLFMYAKQKKHSPYIWTVLALFFGLIAAFTFYWKIIYDELTKIKNNEK